MFGPAVAGMTYGLVPSFPALVPSWIGAFVAVIAFVACWHWMSDLRPSGASADVKTDPAAKKEEHSLSSALLSWPMPLLLFMRIVNGFSIQTMTNLVPLWAISTKDRHKNN